MIAEDPVIAELQQTSTNLEVENNEFHKYKAHLEDEIRKLFVANQKLLDCLKDRCQTRSLLLDENYQMDQKIADKIDDLQKLQLINNNLIKISQNPRFEKPIDVITPTLQQSKRELKEFQQNIKSFETGSTVDDELLGKIANLLDQKLKLTTVNQALQEQILDLQSALMTLDEEGKIPKGTEKKFARIQNLTDIVMSRRKEKYGLENDIKSADIIIDDSVGGNEGNTPIMMNADTIFQSLGISVEDVSKTTIDVLCQTDDSETLVSSPLTKKNEDFILPPKDQSSQHSSSVLQLVPEEEEEEEEEIVEINEMVINSPIKKKSGEKQDTSHLDDLDGPLVTMSADGYQEKEDTLNDSKKLDAIPEEAQTQKDDVDDMVDGIVMTEDKNLALASALLRQQLDQYEKENQMNDALSAAHDRLIDVDSQILELHKENDRRFLKYRDKIRRNSYQNQEIIMSIEPKPKKHFSDESILTENAPDMNELKYQISKKSSEISQLQLVVQQKFELEEILKSKQTELSITTMTNERKDVDIKTLLNRLRIVDPNLYNEAIERKIEIEVDPKLKKKKDRKLQKLAKVEARLLEMKTENKQLKSSIKDQKFLIINMKKQLYGMSVEPKSDVKILCNDLRNSRIIMRENSRQLAFIQLEDRSITQNINSLNTKYSESNLRRIQDKVSQLYDKLNILKTRFNNLRAVKSNRSVILTSDAELTSLQIRIKEIAGEIDVAKMRMNGIISKIDKQMRSVSEENVRLPEPPECWERLQKYIRSKTKLQ